MVYLDDSILQSIPKLGGGFKRFYFYHYLGNDPIWLWFFKWVETTNYCSHFFVSSISFPRRHSFDFFRPEVWKVPRGTSIASTLSFTCGSCLHFSPWRSREKYTLGVSLAAWNEIFSAKERGMEWRYLSFRCGPFPDAVKNEGVVRNPRSLTCV